MSDSNLKILLDTLTKLCDIWRQCRPGEPCGMVATQIDFIKRCIKKELEKEKR